MKSPENGKSDAMESDDFFSATFEQAAVGIAHVAPDGRWLRVNRKLCDIVGYSYAELVKLTFQDITFPDDLETDLEYVRQMLAGEIKTYSLEKRYIRKDKSIVWINLTVSLVRKPSGEPEYFISVIEDIVMCKQTEAALRETQRQLTLLIANLPGVVYRCRNDLNWTTEFVSEGALQLFGYPAADFMEHRLEVGQLIHTDDQGRVWEEIQAALRERRRRYEVTYRIITASGVEKWVWEQGAGVFDASGTLQALEGYVIDITARKRAEMALLETTERLSFIVEGTGTGLWDWNLATNQVSYSREWKGLLGYEEHEVGDHLDEWRRLTHPDDIEPTLVKVNAFLKQPQGAFETEFRMRHKSGEYRWILSRATSPIGNEGKPAHLLGLHIDITERKRAEAALRGSERNLIEAQRIAHFGSWSWNLTGPVQWTDELYRVYGLSPETFTPTIESFFALVYPEDRPAMQEWMRACGAGESPADFEFRAVRPDGTVRFISGRGELVRDDEGRPIQMAGTAQDITERKQAEQRIARLNRLYSVLSKVNEAIVRIHEPEKLYHEVCRIIVEDGLFRMAWIGLVEPETHLVKPAAIHGHEEGYLKEKHISVDEAIPEGRGPTGTAIREGGYFICNDIENDPKMLPWKGQALKRGYSSSAAFALTNGPRIIGTLNVYSTEVNFWRCHQIVDIRTQSAYDCLISIPFASEAIHERA